MKVVEVGDRLCESTIMNAEYKLSVRHQKSLECRKVRFTAQYIYTDFLELTFSHFF